MGFSSLISLFLVWVLFFWFWRDYRRDLCRDRLFAIREGLFDMGLSGEVDFSSPAYRILNSTINGTIQFTHRISLLDFLGFAIASRGKARERAAESYRAKWDQACQSLAPEAQQRLYSIRGKVHFQIFEQIVMTSAILMFSLFSLAFVVALLAIKRQFQEFIKRMLGTPPIGPIADSFDSTVFTYAT